MKNGTRRYCSSFEVVKYADAWVERIEYFPCKTLKELENRCLEQNAEHKDWECTEQNMKLTKDSEALYMHCLPADISSISCDQGEVSAGVFEKYRTDTYVEAGYKPFIIAAMILANRFENPVETLE